MRYSVVEKTIPMDRGEPLFASEWTYVKEEELEEAELFMRLAAKYGVRRWNAEMVGEPHLVYKPDLLGNGYGTLGIMFEVKEVKYGEKK